MQLEHGMTNTLDYEKKTKYLLLILLFNVSDTVFAVVILHFAFDTYGISMIQISVCFAVF